MQARASNAQPLLPVGFDQATKWLKKNLDEARLPIKYGFINETNFQIIQKKRGLSEKMVYACAKNP